MLSYFFDGAESNSELTDQEFCELQAGAEFGQPEQEKDKFNGEIWENHGVSQMNDAKDGGNFSFFWIVTLQTLELSC